ncbi:RHS repeat domain-containing protein [Dokdonella fugitiva]|uniref:YD repeat-containing protein n=1 Tax=Dokdonella fugitiva TaxID=328517 RepID=A0A4R2I2C5_9GAMM|nr:RHS repeat protein [Dokdonella fugitiva]MBA8884757.1 YD repeat-containing protein [Dokdonella fugitiva]TCO37659.1 YD repeat-containing protein [Dokdonella fugitiva]
MKPRRLLVHAALVLSVVQAQAQTATSVRDEYANAVSAAQSPTAFGPDLFGESVNLKDGVTVFSTTDVAGRTQSGLPLAVTRTLGVNAADTDKYVNPEVDGELFGNWKLDVPVIHGTFDERTGWVVASNTPASRCSSGYTPPGVPSAFSNWQITYLPEQYWHGNEISIPGHGKYPLLALPADRPRPDDGQTYVGTTRGDWRVSCVPTLKNGSGEGFKVSLPDGTKYTFDWMSSRKVAALKDKHCKVAYYNEYNVANWSWSYWTFGPNDPSDPNDPNGHWRLNRMDGGALSGGSREVNFCREEIVVNRREYSLHATKVEDRFGNTVTYDYDPANPRRLRAITASDGNAITLAYGTNGKVSSVVHNGRTWRYEYGGTDGTALTSVTLPDNSRWTFQYGDLYTMLHPDNQHILWADCEPHVPGQATADVTIGHPTGAVGVFSFRSMMHGTDRTPGGCYQPDPDKPQVAELSELVMVYKTASLTSKQISGPGLSPSSWTYAYFPKWSWNATGYVDDCSFAAANCDSTVTTEVTAPDGTVTRSTFGNDYWHNAGQLLKVETLSGGSVVQSVTNTYLASATGQPFPDAVGIDPNVRNNRLVTEKNRPLSASVISRDGDQFSRSVQSFDAYARPVRVVKSNSLGYSHEDVTEYYDNLPLWVLGQVRRQYVPSTDVNASNSAGSVIVSETEFNAQALPVKNYAFGRLQQALTYTAAGLLATVADGNGNVTTLLDHYRGLPRIVVFPATPESPSGSSVSAEIDANGWIRAVSDETGAKTCYSYDAMGRTTGIVYPSETQNGVCDASRWTPVTQAIEQIPVEEHGLAAGHWRVQRTEGNHHVNTYLDAQWRPVLEESLDATDPVGTVSQTVKRYDAMGRLDFTSFAQRGVGSYLDALPGNRTRFDALGRTIRTESDNELDASQPLVTTTQYLGGLRTRTTDARGTTTLTAYLAWDEPLYDLPVSIQMPEGKTIAIDRHPKFGWPRALTQRSADDALHETRRYVYDGNAQLCKTIEPETGVTVMGYDAAGNLNWSASGLPAAFADSTTCQQAEAWNAGRRVVRSYDARNRLLTLAFPDGQGDQTWTYTPAGLPARATASNASNGAGAVSTTYAYNRRGLLVAETLAWNGNPAGWTIGYDYDALGHLASQSYPTGLSIAYAPNALGQPTRAGSFASDARYYPNGALQQFNYGNGLV